jgi:hypothetical protein
MVAMQKMIPLALSKRQFGDASDTKSCQRRNDFPQNVFTLA